VKVFGRANARHLGALGMLGALAGGLSLAAPSVSGASSGGTLLVSTSGSNVGSCRVNPCQTIGYALTQATTGSTISVAAGTYAEQLVITNQTVTIKGSGTVTIQPTALPTSDTNSDTGLPAFPVVDVVGGNVNLKNLTIDGSAASSQFTSCGDDFDGVYYHNASGVMSGDTVENIALPTTPTNLDGCQDGNDVLVRSDTGRISSVTVQNGTTLKSYQKNGIFCLDAGTSCTVKDTTITGVGADPFQAGNGFSAIDADSITATGNSISSDSYAGAGGPGNQSEAMYFGDIGTLSVTSNVVSQSDIGIYLTDDGSGPTPGTWTVNGNTVSDATDNIPGGEAKYGDGIQVDSSSNVITISNNTVTHSAENGISLLSAGFDRVSDNHLSHNADNGIYLGSPGSTSSAATSGATVIGNTLKKNGNDGILADTGSSSNSLSGNSAIKNVDGFDYQDLGTANTWSSNTCTPAHDSSPAGLC
jgi:parallel beta-helix repeat protein